MTASTPAHDQDPHGTTDTLQAGTALDEATAAVVFIHGRGATAASILRLIEPLAPEGMALIAPQAYRRSWYPQSFLAPLEANQPGLSSGLRRIGAIFDTLRAHDIPAERVVLGGFSQGACLSTEYAARHPVRYGAIVGLSGGLIGTGEKPDHEPPHDKTFNYTGDMQDTPVFLGCSDRDPHIPKSRVDATAHVFAELNGAVDKRIYESMGHIVNNDEREAVQQLLQAVVEA